MKFIISPSAHIWLANYTESESYLGKKLFSSSILKWLLKYSADESNQKFVCINPASTTSFT